MKSFQLQTQIPRIAGLFLWGLVTLGTPGCESRDEALQAEMVELREQAQRAADETAAAKSRLAKVEIKSVDALRASLEASSKQLRTDLLAAFPGYRPESLKAGEIFYALGETETPYRTKLEFVLKPSSPSALTPEMPPVTVDIAAGPDGEWLLPGQPRLRELQAAASARETAAAQRQAARAPEPAPQPTAQPTPVAQTGGRSPVPQDPSTRVISWGDEPAQPSAPASQPAQPPAQPSAPASAPEPPPQRPPAQVPGQPAAGQTYEIRFD